jgi:hypothetical protein
MSDKIIYQGPSALGILGVILVVLKAIGYIDWSWWWVLAPFWFPLSVVLLILIIAGLFLLFALICKLK